MYRDVATLLLGRLILLLQDDATHPPNAQSTRVGKHPCLCCRLSVSFFFAAVSGHLQNTAGGGATRLQAEGPNATPNTEPKRSPKKMDDEARRSSCGRALLVLETFCLQTTQPHQTTKIYTEMSNLPFGDESLPRFLLENNAPTTHTAVRNVELKRANILILFCCCCCSACAPWGMNRPSQPRTNIKTRPSGPSHIHRCREEPRADLQPQKTGH